MLKQGNFRSRQSAYSIFLIIKENDDDKEKNHLLSSAELTSPAPQSTFFLKMHFTKFLLPFSHLPNQKYYKCLLPGSLFTN